MKQLFSILICLFLFASCEKETEELQLDGKYEGSFIVKGVQHLTINSFALEIQSRRFITNVGGHGLGPFELLDQQRIRFSDERAYPANVNLSTLLSGMYNFELKGDSLILTKIPIHQGAEITYQYRLKKLNL